jgi:hypothetical protein
MTRPSEPVVLQIGQAGAHAVAFPVSVAFVVRLLHANWVCSVETRSKKPGAVSPAGSWRNFGSCLFLAEIRYEDSGTHGILALASRMARQRRSDVEGHFDVANAEMRERTDECIDRI